MIKYMMAMLAFIFLIGNLTEPTQARTWAQGAMKYIHYRGGCSYGRPVIASYYGYEGGRRTATGARFNPSGHTAAHRTARFGTRFHVTNPKNGRSVQVVVNDRGPFVRGVTIDLSRGAAAAIGMNSSQYVCLA